MTQSSSFYDAALESQAIQILYGMDDHEDNMATRIDSYKTGDGKEAEQSAIDRINQLAEALGVQATNWTEVHLGSTYSDFFDPQRPVTATELRRQGLQGTTLGAYLSGLTFGALPIEMDEEGDCEAQVSLALDNNYILNLNGEGNFHTIHPEDEDSDEPSVLFLNLNYSASVVRISP